VKILYVSQYYPPEMGAPAARVAELSRHWVQAGHDVTVLTGFPNHPTGKLAPAYRKAFRRLVSREIQEGVKITRTWLLPLPNRKAHERILNYSSFCISAALSGIFLARPQAVIATSPQLLVGLSGWWLARLKRVPFIFEVRDLWPESLVAVGMGNDTSLLHRALSKIANFLYRHSDRIVVVSPAFKEYLVDRLHVDAAKLFVVENGVETEVFHPAVADSDLEKRLGLEGKFVVSYIGTMGIAHGLETVLNTAERLQHSHPEIAFLFVGEGADKQRVVSIAQQMQLNNVRFISEQPRERIPDFIAASDACLVLLKRDEIFKTVIPTKMLEFMSCARPVILGVDGHARKIIKDAAAGIFIRPASEDDLTAAVIRLAQDNQLRTTLGRNGRKFILQFYSRRQTAKKYAAFLEALIGDQPKAEAAA